MTDLVIWWVIDVCQEELKLQELENKKQEEVNRQLRAAIEEARRRSRVLEKQLREGNNKGNS